MKTKYILWLLIMAFAGWIGCSDDDEKLWPSDIEEFEYKLPQGNHDYDQRIMDWFGRCGFYILYQFEPRDVYFDVDREWAGIYGDTVSEVAIYEIGPTCQVKGDSVYLTTELSSSVLPLGTYYDDSGRKIEVTVTDKRVYRRVKYVDMYGTFKVEEADEEYVGKQLAWAEEMFLTFYPDSVLSSKMPLKLILGKKLKENDWMGGLSDLNYYTFFSGLILSHGDETLDELSLEEKKRIKNEINEWFIFERWKPEFTDNHFSAVTDYYWAGLSSGPSTDQLYGLGMLKSYSGSLEDIQIADFNDYVKMILSYSYHTLIAEPVNSSYNSNNFTGILHPKKDTTGKIRRKYDAIIELFKERSVDLQAIGNLYNE